MKKVERVTLAVKTARTLHAGEISRVKGTGLSVANKDGKYFILGDKKDIRNRDGRMMGKCFKDITNIMTRKFDMGLMIGEQELKTLI